MTDTERLNWLTRNGDGAALINDDAGRWTLCYDGHQNVPSGDGPIDISTVHWIEKGDWHDTIREAIDARIEEYKDAV